MHPAPVARPVAVLPPFCVESQQLSSALRPAWSSLGCLKCCWLRPHPFDADMMDRKLWGKAWRLPWTLRTPSSPHTETIAPTLAGDSRSRVRPESCSRAAWRPGIACQHGALRQCLTALQRGCLHVCVSVRPGSHTLAVQGRHCAGGHGGADGQNLRSLQGEWVLAPSVQAFAITICACLCEATTAMNTTPKCSPTWSCCYIYSPPT